MSRSRKDALARAAEEKSGTYEEMMIGAAKPTTTARTRVSFATPRPDDTTGRRRQRRSSKGESNVTQLVAVPTIANELDRLFDQVTVEGIYDVIDLILPKLHQNDQSIFLQLYRRTHAIGQTKCVISLSELGRLANISVSGATYSVRRLEAALPPFVRRTGKKLGKGKDQGVEIEVFVPGDF